MNKIEEILFLKRNHINAFLAPARSEAEREFFLAAYRFLEYEECGDDDKYIKNDFVHASGNLVYIDEFHGVYDEDKGDNLDVKKLFSQFNAPRSYYPIGMHLVLKLEMLIDGQLTSEFVKLKNNFTLTYTYGINYSEKIFRPSIKIFVKHNISVKIKDSEEYFEEKEGVFYVVLPPNKLNADELNQCLRQGFNIFQLDEKEVAELWTHEKFKSFLLSLTKNVCKDCLLDKRNISL
jgi:hypothetical protein